MGVVWVGGAVFVGGRGFSVFFFLRVVKGFFSFVFSVLRFVVVRSVL